MRPFLILFFLALVLLAGAPRASVNATTAPPPAFLSGTFCPDNDPAAMFIVPGIEETADILAARGISGRVDAVWIDLSLFDNDFAQGTFLGLGPNTPDPDGAVTRAWRGLDHETTHFYRLNARVGDRWVELGRGTFRTNNCLVLLQVLCEGDDSVRATFEPLQPGILEQGGLPTETWIDLSLFNNGFAAGTFIGNGPVAFNPHGARNDSDWPGLLPGRTHYYRENTHYSAAGWVPQYNGSFDTPTCASLPKKYKQLPL